jgi:hypothetical protein
MTPMLANIVGPPCSTTKHQRLDRGLPVRERGFLFRKRGDESCCVAKRYERSAVGRLYRIVEPALPAAFCASVPANPRREPAEAVS